MIGYKKLRAEKIESILQTTESIAQEVVAVNADVVDKEARWPEQNLRALQAAQLTSSSYTKILRRPGFWVAGIGADLRDTG